MRGREHWLSVANADNPDDLREEILTGFKGGKPFTSLRGAASSEKRGAAGMTRGTIAPIRCRIPNSRIPRNWLPHLKLRANLPIDLMGLGRVT